MDDFPSFMKSPTNKIATGSQATPGVEGYVFDGADGSQMAFWTCRENAVSSPHVHEFDEYMIVVQGCYTLTMGGRRIAVAAEAFGMAESPRPAPEPSTLSAVIGRSELYR
jgi:quercetin dioxygenase-like cupin family protein